METEQGVAAGEAAMPMVNKVPYTTVSFFPVLYQVASFAEDADAPPGAFMRAVLSQAKKQKLQAEEYASEVC